MQKVIKVRRIANPRRKSSAKRKRRRNPLRVVTLGRKNPRKRSASTMRRKRRTTRRRNSAAPRRRRRVTRRRSNPVARRRTRRTRRRANPVRARRRSYRRRRNPSLFGSRVSTGAMMQAVLGGLVGVTATKMIPTMLPVSLTATPVMRVLSSIASAFGSGWLAGRVSQPFGDAVLFGGLMQAGSLALNAFVPSIGSQIGLAGLGELVPGAYPVPQNPLNPGQMNYPAYGIAAPANATYGSSAPVTMNGLSRAFGAAF